MRGKLLTIAGIVLIFGYFIMESFRNPSSTDPTQVVMVGKDTLGRDWGAIADQKAREKEELFKSQQDASANEGEVARKSLIGSDDPYQRSLFNSSDYSSIQAADGREIITGYNPIQQEEDNNNVYQNFQTRHQKESGRRENEEPVPVSNPYNP